MRKVILFFTLTLLISACGDSSDPKALFDEGKYLDSYRLWLPLATDGDLVAQNYLGIEHYLGLGVKRDHKAAKEWFEKAAMGGYADAQYNLGVMYLNGEFVERNFETAYMWFYLAKQNGNKNAAKRMKSIASERKLFPNQINRAVELAKDFMN